MIAFTSNPPPPWPNLSQLLLKYATEIRQAKHANERRADEGDVTGRRPAPTDSSQTTGDTAPERVGGKIDLLA